MAVHRFRQFSRLGLDGSGPGLGLGRSATCACQRSLVRGLAPRPRRQQQEQPRQQCVPMPPRTLLASASSSFADTFAHATTAALETQARVSLTRVMHGIWRRQHSKGDLLVDATVGRGRDTFVLARLAFEAEVGLEEETGIAVYGFDVQRQAIDQAREYLAAHLTPQETNRIQLHEKSHAELGSTLRENGVAPGSVGNVVFNLGYLPGSTCERVARHGGGGPAEAEGLIITRAESTLAAVEQSLPFLRRGGLISLLCYVGHDGGMHEYLSVKRRCAEIALQRRGRSDGKAGEDVPSFETHVYDPHKEGKSHTELCPKIVILHKL